MTLFALIREYIAALREQTAATREATAAQNRALSDAAWARFTLNRPHHRLTHHGHGHAGGNASMPGAAE
jgi:hypothetical protein